MVAWRFPQHAHSHGRQWRLRLLHIAAPRASGQLFDPKCSRSAPAACSLCTNLQATAFVGRTNPELMPALRAWTIAFMPAMAAQLRKQDVSDSKVLALLARSLLEQQRGCDNQNGTAGAW